MAKSKTPSARIRTKGERRAAGKLLRNKCPREAHAKITGFTQNFKLYNTDSTFSGSQASASLGNKVGDIGSAPPLPGSLNGNVVAVAVFGNPATKFGNPISAAGSFAGKAIDLCANGDPICSDGRNPFAHTNYESSPFVGQAAGFAVGRI